MSEEEKEAIETTKILIEFSGDNYIPKQNREKLQILLNLIEKQQKEIDKLHTITQNYDVIDGTFKRNYIFKSKIIEKIKELEKEAFKSIAISEKINILKELLEENSND